jgi:hypothetical protein
MKELKTHHFSHATTKELTRITITTAINSYMDPVEKSQKSSLVARRSSHMQKENARSNTFTSSSVGKLAGPGLPKCTYISQ